MIDRRAFLRLPAAEAIGGVLPCSTIEVDGGEAIGVGQSPVRIKFCQHWPADGDS